jgi:fatty acid amide hydrolase 2
MDRLLHLSATRLATLIREGSVSSLEVTRTHIDRIQRVNPSLNAVVCDRFDAALEEAARADARRALSGDDLPPLHGVPCTIKEAFALEGMPNCAGLAARRTLRSREDATAVARLRRAGAIPLGVTNVSELCMWMESSNTVYGRTRNAHDPGRTSGGSSGGEGAIVGAGGSPFGLGSDVGGSIRMPAFFNGVFGHKPTGGLVPSTGQFPVAENEALRYLTSGPLARRAEDLMPLLRILAGPDGKDPACVAMKLGDPKDVRLRGLRVVHVPDNGMTRVDPVLVDAQDRAAEALRERGANVVRARVDQLRSSLEMWSSMMSAAGGTAFGTLLGNGEPIDALAQLARWAVGRSPHTLPAIALTLIEKVPALMPGRTEKMVALTRALRHDVVSLIGEGGVMLFPSYSMPAPRHHRAFFPPVDWAYTAIFNVLELPVTQVPLGLGARGLPLGVQVVGVHADDHVTIAVAEALEEIFGGWVPPRQFDEPG